MLYIALWVIIFLWITVLGRCAKASVDITDKDRRELKKFFEERQKAKLAKMLATSSKCQKGKPCLLNPTSKIK